MRSAPALQFHIALCAALMLLVARPCFADAGYLQDPEICSFDGNGWQGTQVVMNECAERQFKKNDAELKRVYKEQLAFLKNANNRRKFQQAQQSWLNYRYQSCGYEVAFLGNGTLSGYIRPMCETKLTQQRIEQIKADLGCRGNDCPK